MTSSEATAEKNPRDVATSKVRGLLGRHTNIPDSRVTRQTFYAGPFKRWVNQNQTFSNYLMCKKINALKRET